MNNPIVLPTRDRIRFADGKIQGCPSELLYVRMKVQILDYIAKVKLGNKSHRDASNILGGLSLSPHYAYTNGVLSEEDDEKINAGMKKYNVCRDPFKEYNKKYIPRKHESIDKSITLDVYLRAMHRILEKRGCRSKFGLHSWSKKTPVIRFTTFAKMYVCICAMGGQKMAEEYIPEGYTLAEVLSEAPRRITRVSETEAEVLRAEYLNLCKEENIPAPKCYHRRPADDMGSIGDALEQAKEERDAKQDAPEMPPVPKSRGPLPTEESVQQTLELEHDVPDEDNMEEIRKFLSKPTDDVKIVADLLDILGGTEIEAVFEMFLKARPKYIKLKEAGLFDDMSVEDWLRKAFT